MPSAPQDFRSVSVSQFLPAYETEELAMKSSHSLASASLVTLALALGVLVVAGHAEDPAAAAGDGRVHAERCVKAAPTEVVARIACNRIANIRTDVPESRRAEFAKAMQAELDLDVMRAKRVEIMAKTFTADELKALADFYESSSGHSAWQKLDSYVIDMQAAMKTKMQEAESRARSALKLPARE